MSVDGQRVKEAAKLMLEGDKAASKGVFRKPDYDMAGQFYNQAANVYKNARAYDAAIAAYVKASEAMSNLSPYMAAKALETAGQIAEKQFSQFDRAADLYRRSSGLFATQGAADRAAEMLEKAAKVLETADVGQSIELYTAACNLYMQEDRGRFAIDTFKKTISLMVRNRKYERAVEMLLREIEVLKTMAHKTALYQAYLSVIIIQLQLGDEIAAQKSMQRFTQQYEGFLESEECNICHGLLDAFQQGDQELLQQQVSRQTITFLDNDITRLARGLKVSSFDNPLGVASSSNSSAPPRGASSGIPPVRDQYSLPGPPLPPGVKDSYTNASPQSPPRDNTPLPVSSSTPSRSDHGRPLPPTSQPENRNNPPRNSSATPKSNNGHDSTTPAANYPMRSNSLRNYNNGARGEQPPPVPGNGAPRYQSPTQTPRVDTSVSSPRGYDSPRDPAIPPRGYDSRQDYQTGYDQTRNGSMSPHTRSYESLPRNEQPVYDPARANPMSPHGVTPSRSYDSLPRQERNQFDHRGGSMPSPTVASSKTHEALPRQEQGADSRGPTRGYDSMPRQDQNNFDPSSRSMSPPSAMSPTAGTPTRGYESMPRPDQNAYDPVRMQQETAGIQDQGYYESARTASPARGGYDPQSRYDQGHWNERSGEQPRGRQPNNNTGFSNSMASPKTAPVRVPPPRSNTGSAPSTPVRQNFGSQSRDSSQIEQQQPRSSSMTRKYDSAYQQQPRNTAGSTGNPVMSPSNSTSGRSNPRQQSPLSQPMAIPSQSQPHVQSSDISKPPPSPNPIDEYKFERLADKVEARQARKATPSQPLTLSKSTTRDTITHPVSAVPESVASPISSPIAEEEDVGYNLDDYLDDRFSKISMQPPNLPPDNYENAPPLPTSPVSHNYVEPIGKNPPHEYQGMRSREDDYYTRQDHSTQGRDPVQQYGSGRASQDQQARTYEQQHRGYEQPQVNKYGQQEYRQPPPPQQQQQQQPVQNYFEEDDSLC